MLSVEEATKIILSNPCKPRIATVGIMESTGKVLAQQIKADRDFPPFHRVTMDGIAINFDRWKMNQSELSIESLQAAGQPQQRLWDAAHCVEVMTGAVLPEGTDTVIRYEDLEMKGNNVMVLPVDIQRGQSIHQQGQDAKEGEVLLEPGMILSPAEIALLASVGKGDVNIFTFPKTAIVASGDELVEINATPEPQQIRRSNTYAILAAMKILGWEGTPFHLPDQKDVLLSSLKTIAQNHEVIILSGGVSKGKFDFIPEVLEEIGIKKLFHQVSQRPGKPFWFGVSKNGKTVFALPGNPVSTYMCFYRYIKPWLVKSMSAEVMTVQAVLATDFVFKPQLTYFLQVRIKNELGKLMAYPDAGGGSGDFANLKDVDGFLELPLERSEFKSGEVFPYYPFR